MRRATLVLILIVLRIYKNFPQDIYVIVATYFFMSFPFLFEQAMRTLVTCVASFEFAEHCRVVRFAMAILTLRNHGMFVGMAEYTLESCMFCGTGFKGGFDVIVTGATVPVGNFGTIGKLQGLMDLVTFDTVRELLLFDMRLVAVQAVRLVTMFVVAEGTVNLCMGAWCCVNLCNNI
jgi:hypothetical protein